MMKHPHVLKRPLSRLGALSLVVFGLVVAGAAAPAGAAVPTQSSSERSVLHHAGEYVALGDSYTGGQGVPPYESGPCLRSAFGSYPHIVAAISPYRLVANKACTAATIADVYGQLAGVSPTTDLVTLTVGGIDAGSNVVLAACAPDPAAPACVQAIQASIAGAPALQPAFTELYSTIAATLPEARVVVLGYPRIFEPGLLPLGDLYNAATDTLNAVIRDAVAATGNPRITFTDVTDEFDGHGIGSAVPYIAFNPTNPADPTSLHPNVLGNVLGYTLALVHDGVIPWVPLHRMSLHR